MTTCPIVLAVGCERCPVFKLCPLTTVLGDQKKNRKKIKTKSPKKNDHDSGAGDGARIYDIQPW